MKLLAGIAVAQYALFSISTYKMAKYLCMRFPLLSFVPIVNLIYFCFVSDTVSVEAKSSGYSYSGLFMIAAIIVTTLGIILLKGFHYDITLIMGRILLFVGIAEAFITLSFSFMSVLVETMRFPALCILASFVVTPPVFMLIASFKLPSVMEEVIELYY